MTSLAATHTIAGLFADHGGPSRSVPALCDALADLISVSVVTGSPPARRTSLRLPQKAQSVVVSESALWGRALGMRRLRRALHEHLVKYPSQIIHDHGLWLPSNYVSAAVAASSGIPRVVSPRGMLSGWALGHKGMRKQLAWKLYQKRVLEGAASFHATAQKEADEIRTAGFRQPIAVIPNGVNLPEASGDPNRWIAPERVALFMSRLHPKKGVADLVGAWAAARPAGWKLWIAGPDEDGSRARLERRAGELGIAADLKFLGEVADTDKWNVLQQACLFVLPSYDENYGIVVAEAMAAGLPVITTTATPWGELGTRGAGWCVPSGADALVEALRAATAMDSGRLQEMGRQARSWAEQSLGWPRIAQQMVQFYEWLIVGRAGRSGARPDWVLE